MVRFTKGIKGHAISGPSDCREPLRRFWNKRQEHFIVFTLDAAHHIIAGYIVTIGIVNRTLVAPREIFYPAIKDNAVAVIVAHNHPSGECVPSGEDRSVTTQLLQAGNVLAISVLDHIIVGKQGKYYSFSEHNEIEQYKPLFAASR